MHATPHGSSTNDSTHKKTTKKTTPSHDTLTPPLAHKRQPVPAAEHKQDLGPHTTLCQSQHSTLAPSPVVQKADQLVPSTAPPTRGNQLLSQAHLSPCRCRSTAPATRPTVCTPTQPQPDPPTHGLPTTMQTHTGCSTTTPELQPQQQTTA